MLDRDRTLSARHKKRIPADIIEKITTAFDSDELSIDLAVQIIREHKLNTYSLIDDFSKVDNPARLRDWFNVISKIIHDVYTNRDKRKLVRISNVMTDIRIEERKALDDRDARKLKALDSKYNRLQAVMNKILATGIVI